MAKQRKCIVVSAEVADAIAAGADDGEYGLLGQGETTPEKLAQEILKSLQGSDLFCGGKQQMLVEEAGGTLELRIAIHIKQVEMGEVAFPPQPNGDPYDGFTQQEVESMKKEEEDMAKLEIKVTAELEVYKGFEIPVTTSKAARKVIKRLAKKGIVIFEHDDGPSLQVREELVKILEAVGIRCIKDTHTVIFMTNKFYNKMSVRGDKFSH